jgi:hypothetical protein
MANSPFLIGAFFGIIPAMGFLYILLNNYQPFFNEKRLFKTFFLGFIVGLVAVVIENTLGPGRSLDPAVDGALGYAGLAGYALLFGLLETLMATAVLNWRTYRGRKDTPFYGPALGLGFGAVSALFIVGSRVLILTGGATGWQEVVLLSLFGLYFIGSILIHAGAFTIVATGTANADLTKPIILSTLIIGGYLWILFLLPHLPGGLANLMPIVAIAAAIAFIAYVMREILDKVVPEEVQREAGIHLRRMARKRMREGERPPQAP